MRLLFLLLTLAATLAQGLIINPYYSAPVYNLPAGIKHRWKASDLSGSPVSTWTDSVSGFNMTQTTGSQQPTWDATGVIFDGVNDLLVITNVASPVSPTAYACLVVLNFATVNATEQVLCNSATGGNIFIGFNSAGCLYEGGVGDAICGITTGNTMDILTTTFGSAPVGRTFTNGVEGWNGAGTWNGGTTISKLGASSAAGANAVAATVKEVIIWTNTTFTAADVTAIHAYATNTYTFSP